MSSRKKRDFSQDLDQSELRSNVVSPQKEPNETLFQFFKKKTKFNIDKSYKNNLQNNKRYSSVQPEDREQPNSNMQFLKKLNDTISPTKKIKPQLNNFTSPPKPNLTLTTETKNLSFDSSMNATWTSKGADDRRYSSFVERETPKEEEFSQTADNFNRSGSKKYNSTNPLRSSARKVQFSEKKYQTDKSEVRESDNHADDEEFTQNTYETTSRANQIATIHKKLVSMGSQMEDSFDKVKYFSENNVKKIEKLIKYIESNEYFDSSTLKNLTAECKVTTLSLNKTLSNNPVSGFSLKLLKEFDDLHRKERENQVEEAKNQIRHAMAMQKNILDKRNFELGVEIERLRHELVIHQENNRNREQEKRPQKSSEVEELQAQNAQLQYKLDKIHKENAILRDEYLEVQRRLERETEYLKEELKKALEVVDLPLNRGPSRDKENTSTLKEAFRAYRGESGSKNRGDSASKSRSRTIEDDEETVLRPKGERPENGVGDNVRFLKLEVQSLKSEKAILMKENENLLQKLTDQIMMERDMKKIISKNEELQQKLKNRKAESDNLWNAMREIKAHMIRVSKLNDLMIILRKNRIEEKAKKKFESRFN